MDHLTAAQEKAFDSPFGAVTCKIPSAKKVMEIARRTQVYAGAMPLATQEWNLAEAMAYLDVCITDAPEEFARDKNTPTTWDYDKIYDTDALIELGKQVKEWIASFRKPVREEQA